jgi:hypothetical protein
MKKVYGNSTLAITASVICVVCVIVFLHDFKSKNILPLIIMCLFFWKTVLPAFIPQWSYNDKGFEKGGESEKKFHPWSSVKNITYSRVLDQVWVDADVDVRLTIGMNYTRGFKKILPEVVDLIRKNNHKVEIPQVVLERLKKMDKK